MVNESSAIFEIIETFLSLGRWGFLRDMGSRCRERLPPIENATPDPADATEQFGIQDSRTDTNGTVLSRLLFGALL
jgi:hypothetical protein